MDRNGINFLLYKRSIGLWIHRQLLQLVERLKAVDYSSEDGVLEVERRLRCVGDEELALVRVDAGVCHRDESALGMLEVLFELVLELLAPYRLAALSGVGGIARLHHEAFNAADKDASIVVVGGAKSEEVLRRLRRVLTIHFDLDVAHVRVQCD